MEFHVVRHDCSDNPRPVVAEIAIGLVRVKCPGCKRRLMVASDGATVSITLTDEPPERLN